MSPVPRSVRWAEVVGVEQSAPLLCPKCKANMLPPRERLQQALRHAVEQLTAATVSRTTSGMAETIAALAGMSYALLYSLQLLELCEPCVKVKFETAAALIVDGSTK